MADAPVKDEKTADKVKKPYVAPQLQKWGSLSDITKAVGGSGAQDGGRVAHKEGTR
jgi:hypothetical protein